MRVRSLPKENLERLLRRWAAGRSVVAPGRTPQGDCVYAEFDPETFLVDFGKPPLPPKALFLPQSEVIFEVDEGQYRERIRSQPTVLFGLRACDLMGLRQTTAFMTRDGEDAFFSARRRSTATVVVACPGPQNETCFCTTTRSGPCAEKGFDLQLFDMGDRFWVEVATPVGADLLLEELCGEVDEGRAREELRAFREKAAGSMAEVREVGEAMALLREGRAPDAVWDRFGQKCIVCGGCTFVCPTCTCFNVTDRVLSPAGGLRLRGWDACLFAGFTRETSGHNPRPTQASRVQRRQEHKLRYFSGADIQEGLCGCVGCGRCSDACPVHIGTLEVVKAIVS